MDYSNPEIPEGINTSKGNPLKEFILLLAGIMVAIILVVAVLGFFIEKIAVFIPFSVERNLIPDIVMQDDMDKDNPVSTSLNKITSDLIPLMELPDDIEIHIHYIDNPAINAYASLGGHINVHRGLLENIHDENTLSMVIAHEIAHIKFRHPVIAMGRGVVIGLLLTSLTGINNDYLTGKLVGDTGIATLLTFNRRMESEADQAAVQALVSRYGHIGGAISLFELFALLDKSMTSERLELFSTHPMSDKRIRHIREMAEKNNWTMDGPRVDIPGPVQALILAEHHH